MSTEWINKEERKDEAGLERATVRCRMNRCVYVCVYTGYYESQIQSFLRPCKTQKIKLKTPKY